MSARKRSRIIWSNVSTVVSAAVLIGAEVFGAAYAGGWALATLFGFEELGQRLFEACFIAVGVYIMYVFLRNAQRVEPFVARE
jgi:hypothetical protein